VSLLRDRRGGNEQNPDNRFLHHSPIVCEHRENCTLVVDLKVAALMVSTPSTITGRWVQCRLSTHQLRAYIMI
jgi:hypothetical protein